MDGLIKDYWTANGLVKPQRVVVCAACKMGSIIFAGARHWDSVMRSQLDLLGGYDKMIAIYGKEEQGFIDQFGEFMTRKEALEVAIKAGQKINWERNGSKTGLFSEGLY